MKRETLALIAVILIGLWLRIPGISQGLPFFRNEDEAHHFNRTVEMVKKGEFNPNYFHKPSLHFYLRMPVVAISFLWSVKRGYIRELKEIRTRDTFGVGDYAFTASHPGIVKWNRAFSVLMSLLVIVFTYLIAKELFDTPAISIFAAFVAALSPELIRNSPIVGVDMLMTLMCVAAVYASILCYKSPSKKRAMLSGILAGLAVSSKYNALPIMVLPAAAVLLAGTKSVNVIMASILSPVVGFFAGSPFILASLPLFLDHFAYEIWHYGIEGHGGHTAERGLPQALFYFDWLKSDALGWALVAASIAGAALLFRREAPRRAMNFLFILFPALFFVLMIDQRANFTRNMIVIIPLLGVCAAYGLNYLLGLRTLPRLAVVALYALVLAQPMYLALELRAAIRAEHDSRSILIEKMTDGGPLCQEKIAVAGQLQLPPSLYTRSNVVKFDQDKMDLSALRAAQVKQIVLAPGHSPAEMSANSLTLTQKLDGVDEKQRIVDNPAIYIYSFNTPT